MIIKYIRMVKVVVPPTLEYDPKLNGEQFASKLVEHLAYTQCAAQTKNEGQSTSYAQTNATITILSVFFMLALILF